MRRPACRRRAPRPRAGRSPVLDGQHERVRAAVDRGQLLVGDVSGEDHVGQLVRPRAASDRRARAAARAASRPAWRCAARVGMAAGPRPTAGSARAARSAPALRATSAGAARRTSSAPGASGSRRPLAARGRSRCDGVRWRPPRVGTITRTARCTASWRRRRRRPVADARRARFSAMRSWSVTTIGQGLCSIAPSHPRRVVHVGARGAVAFRASLACVRRSRGAPQQAARVAPDAVSDPHTGGCRTPPSLAAARSRRSARVPARTRKIIGLRSFVQK